MGYYMPDAAAVLPRPLNNSPPGDILMRIMKELSTPRIGGRQGAAILALVACALLWSTGGLLIKAVTWNPMAIAGVRSVIGGIVILVWVRRPRFTWSFAQIMGAVSYAGCMILFVIANKLTTAANAIMLQYTAPLYAAVLGWIFLKEKASAVDWITIVVVLGGMALFFMDKLTLGGMQGNLLAVASGVFFAVAMVCFRAQKDSSSIESILLSHAVTVIVCLPFLFGGAPTFGGFPGLSPKASLALGVGGLACLGVFQIGISSILLSFGVKHVSALQTLLTAVLEPIFNPVWVFLVLGERPGRWALVGAVVILVAVTLRSVISLRSGSRSAASG
jgi:drug/metabolite transporter (DMT)-like permease